MQASTIGSITFAKANIWGRAIFVNATYVDLLLVRSRAPRQERRGAHGALPGAGRRHAPRILAILAYQSPDGPGAELCVCHIHDSLGVSQPTASRHLAYLRKAGLVEARRQGVWMHYRIVRPEDPVMASVFDAALHALGHADSTARDRAKLARVALASPVS